MTTYGSDRLSEGILENVTDDFLRFFFMDISRLFDLEKRFTYLDKELADLFPNENTPVTQFR